ncbi:four helix bundle protein [Candidatus Microgenomates bacterium]|nr:four helix bundle protein [Candidatus Microgenomates bacterium]
MTQSPKRKYDLEERTAKFGEDVIKLCKNLKQDAVSRPIISQLVRSATSVGANYAEANGASSKLDFRNKIHIAKKELQETKHSLRMLKACFPDQSDAVEPIWKENQELLFIFQKITNSLRSSR